MNQGFRYFSDVNKALTYHTITIVVGQIYVTTI